MTTISIAEINQIDGIGSIYPDEDPDLQADQVHLEEYFRKKSTEGYARLGEPADEQDARARHDAIDMAVRDRTERVLQYLKSRDRGNTGNKGSGESDGRKNVKSSFGSISLAKARNGGLWFGNKEGQMIMIASEADLKGAVTFNFSGGDVHGGLVEMAKAVVSRIGL